MNARNESTERSTDADLTSGSCLGIGVEFPHLWDVVKRYILRGDNYFQSGGLTVLVATISSMPLDQSAEVLEKYYEQHDYLPPAEGQRGGVNLVGLQAIHAVATAPDPTTPSAQQTRRARMLRLLETHRDAVHRALSAPSIGPDYMAGDRAAVDRTIEAVVAGEPWGVSSA